MVEAYCYLCVNCTLLHTTFPIISYRYSYDPFHHSPNENPEAELAVNAGDYVLVWGSMDEVAPQHIVRTSESTSSLATTWYPGYLVLALCPSLPHLVSAQCLSLVHIVSVWLLPTLFPPSDCIAYHVMTLCLSHVCLPCLTVPVSRLSAMTYHTLVFLTSVCSLSAVCLKPQMDSR